MTISAAQLAPSTDQLALVGLRRPPNPSQAFDALLDRASRGATSDEVRRSAEQLVSATFVVPLLRQVRESSQAVEPFAPTPAEKQFGALLDQRIADDLVRASKLPIVDRLVATIDPSQGGANR